MQKTFLIISAIAGLTAVGLGAFGAHGLRAVLSHEQLAVWEKGVQYQMYHALALFIFALVGVPARKPLLVLSPTTKVHPYIFVFSSFIAVM